MKIVFDLSVSLIVILLVLIPGVLIAVLIKLDSKGPIFFIQERMGYGKNKFKLIKFRTMTDKERSPSGEVFLDHPEITKIGKFLRRFKIDELPQFLNVLKGDMSVVGPRPCLESTYHKFKDENTDYRFLVKPGVTSNAGVKGSIFLSWPEKWALDREYAENASFIYDLKTIFKTILVVIFGEQRFKKTS